MGFIRDMFSSPDPPPPINYGQLQQDQQVLDEDAARLQTALSRPDLVTPYSTTTFRETAPDQYLGTYTLAQPYEDLRVQEAELQRGLQGLSTQRLGQIDRGAFTTAGLPGEPAPFTYDQFGAQPTYSTAGASYQLPGFSDLNTFTSNAADEFFNRAVARLNPQFDRAEAALRTQLITSGIPEGSDAFNQELELFRQQKNDQLADLASQSVFQGQTLQSNILGNILQGRGQQLQELGTEFDVATGQRGQQIAEAQNQYALAQQARDRAIAERLRERQQPMTELSAMLTGTTPFSQAAAQGPGSLAPVAGPPPADLGALAAAQQADRLARFQGAQQAQATALSIPTTLAAAYLGRPR
ncbi:hypothetical protein CMI37_21625 [Candidatus Pacearchaeota archaeon]|nr:hypothetical protein [Candidatus Pacearchaeota archaeon]|tara:strand:+ start:1772 stop:2836 length:1065 start_codon:yes stop_codon:yes gene_type:complete